MRKISLLIVLCMAQWMTWAQAVPSGDLFATYQKAGDTFYRGNGTIDEENPDPRELNINYYIVTCGQTMLFRAVSPDQDIQFGGAGWETQLRVKNSSGGSNYEVQACSAVDNYNHYTGEGCNTHFTATTEDLLIHFFLSTTSVEGGYRITETFDFNRASINNPIDDEVAPAITPDEVQMTEEGEYLVFTFGDVTADDEYFYYVGDKDHHVGAISLTNTVSILKPTVEDGTLYSFKCYAVDFNGNKSAYKEYTLQMPFDPAIDLALGKTCKAGAVQDANTPDRAVNGNPDNFWTCFGQGEAEDWWWSVDLGNIYDLSSISIHFNDVWGSFSIYSSLDEETWHPFVQNASAANDGIITYESLDFSARYLKVVSAVSQIGIKEFQVYGTGVSTDPVEPGDEPEPITIHVLSINNSLIDYNSQNEMFNSMAAAMGKDAHWTKHTNLGKTLAYHFNEDPLNPNAQTVVATTAWDYIILQEQSFLPRTDLEQFRSNVQTWVNYIRANCPNPDAVVILPINWALTSATNYQEDNKTLIANFRSVAEEFGAVLCPVAIAYGNYQIDHPTTIASDLYTDDRHPTNAASYLACCLEYAIIFDEDPSSITWKPASVSETMAASMRAYAQEAYEGVEREESQPEEPTAAISITEAIAYVQNFDAIGGEDVDPAPCEKTAYVRETTLPEGWRIDNNTTAVRSLNRFANASETTMYIGGQALASNAKNGTWNFGATGSTDRAVGGITSSIDGGARTINVMAHLHNDADADITSLALSYDIEKYRNGANEAGFVIQLYSSLDGITWTSAGETFKVQYTKDADTNGADIVPILAQTVEGDLACTFPKDGDFYLAWSISPASGMDCAKSMAFGIDNVSITPTLTPTGVERVDSQESIVDTRKFLRNGVLYIIRGNHVYNATGIRVK